VANIISTQKNELIGPYHFESQATGNFRLNNVAEVYTLYQNRLRANNAMDFDDIIFRTVEMLDTQKDVLAAYQNRFHYVMVDEYQDTNTAQYKLISLLSGYAQNLCVVGDDDQSIYGWRGANIQNILNFKQDFPSAEVIKLEQNYRSTQTILNAANAVIGNNRNRSPKKLWTENEQGTRIYLYKAYNESEEGAFIAKTVKDGIQEGNNYNDFAVLYRNNAQSRAVEDALVMAGIPYRLFGGVRFYERAEVKDLLAYLKALHNPADDLAWQRVINTPRRGIGNTTVAKVMEYAYENGLPFSFALREADNIAGLKNKVKALLPFVQWMDECTGITSVTELLQKIMDDTRFLEHLSDGTIEGEGRIENARELLSKAVEFEKTSENKSLGTFLEEVALVADVDNYEENADTVVLMTLHSAKGLEFNRVFVTGFEENLFPSTRSVLSTDEDDLEEERRLCYVGFTRARKLLYITHALTRMLYGQTLSNAPSRFLREVPKEYIETVSSNNKRERLKERVTDVKKITHKPAVNPYLKNISAPKGKDLDFIVGDRVKQMKYGVGEVTAIRPAGADYEVTVTFQEAGQKKFMAHLAKLVKV
jgi:DNA helicase-2/ATP-dependent DNA helicase PcrA